ncbi:hypothetical protein [Salinivirga cyanobacteriivorans]|uniref:hypothetical protein n=1 Tax=Salinivirga cyanobacteriivorans TaxID=1307839 RepID=UPI000716CC49|nr:hypothetical protein [Salinivirga cyanobacteriivorans]
MIWFWWYLIRSMGSVPFFKVSDSCGYGSNAYFWTADTNKFYKGWGQMAYMYYFSSRVMINTIEKRLGMSVRCIKI